MTERLEYELIAHAATLRRLAADLVGGSDADDLVQETALHALRAPRREGHSLAGFFATILRHLASKHRRSERRRRQRERTAAKPEAVPPHDVALAHHETLRRLTEALVAMPEPYRGALLLRYYEERAPAAIAAQSAEPLATVKSRLQRGLAMLRERLDRDADRGDWRGALVSAFGLGDVAKLGTAASFAATTTGVILMGTGVKLAIGGAAALAAVVAAFLVVGGEPAPSARVAAANNPVPAAATGGTVADQPAMLDSAATDSASQRREAPATPTGPTVTLHVVAFGTKSPVAGAEVYVKPEVDWDALQDTERAELGRIATLDSEQFIRKLGKRYVTDEAGQCRVVVDRVGSSLYARSGDLYGETFARGGASAPVEVVVRRDVTLRVRVLDAGNAPVAGVSVGVEDDKKWSIGPTDANGRCERRHVQSHREDIAVPVNLVAIAVAGKGPPVSIDLVAPPAEVVLHLPPTGVVTVHARDRDGRPLDLEWIEDRTVYLVDGTSRPAFGWQSVSSSLNEHADAVFRHVALDQQLQARFGETSGPAFAGPTLGNPRVEVTLNETNDAVLLVGTVRQPGNAPLAHMSVAIEANAEGTYRYLGCRTKGDGRIRVNLGSTFVGRQAVIECTQGWGREDDLTCRLPSRELNVGINDLGVLELLPKQVMVAGKLIGEGVSLPRVSLSVYRKQEGRWQQVINLVADWPADGSFRFRGALPTGEPLQVHVSDGSYLPVEPIECKCGDQNLEIHLRAAGELTARLLLDDQTSTDNMYLHLRASTREAGRSPVSSIEDTASLPLQREKDSARRRWTGLGPGNYRLSVLCRGSDTPLAELDDLLVEDGPCIDPRLTIDLRGRLRAIEVRAAEPDGTPITDRGALVVVRGSVSTWVAYNLGKGVVRLATPDDLHLLVVAPAHVTATVDAVTESRTVTLQPAASAAIAVRLPSELPADTTLRLRLRPQLVLPRHQSIQCDNVLCMSFEQFFADEVLVGADGIAHAPVRWPGSYTVEALFANGGSPNSRTLDLTPSKLMLPGDAEVRIDQKGFDAAMQGLRR